MIEEYQLPQHILDLAKKCSVPESFLKPEIYLFNSLHVKHEFHDALVDVTPVEASGLLDKQQLQEDLQQSFEENDISFLGIDHNSFRSHEFVAQMLSKVEGQFSIAVEYPLEFQKYIDFFLQTGKFRDGDNQSLYSKIYKTVQRTFKNIEIPEDLTGTIFDEIPHLIQIYPILLVARAKATEVFSFDPLNEAEHRTPQSEQMMKNQLTNHSEQHIFVVVGAEHTLKGEYTDEGEPLTSLRVLCEQDQMKVKSYYFDSYQDFHLDWMEDQVTETVMHAAVIKKADNMGKNDRLIGYNSPELQAQLGGEVYVAVR
jgi:hypothetical protein